MDARCPSWSRCAEAITAALLAATAGGCPTCKTFPDDEFPGVRSCVMGDVMGGAIAVAVAITVGQALRQHTGR